MLELLLLAFAFGAIAGVVVMALIALLLRPGKVSATAIDVIADKAHHRAIEASQLGTAQMLKAMGEMRSTLREDLRFITGHRT